MASEDGNESVAKNVERKSSYGSDSHVSISPEDDGRVELIEKNPRIFCFFTHIGMYNIHYDSDMKKYRMSKRKFVFFRFCWFLFHVSVAGLGLWLNTLAEPESPSTINDFLWGSILILVFMIVDPIQTMILKRSMEILPGLLNKEVKDLEKLTKEKLRKSLRNVDPSSKHIKKKISLTTKTSNVEDGVDSKSDCCSRFGLFLYDWYNKITLLILLLGFLGLFIYGFGREAGWTVVVPDPALVVMFFYLFFPMLSTWFCVVFIKYERRLYEIFDEDIDDHITDLDFDNKIKDISDYIQIMQVLFKRITDHFFKFVFGINSMMFVVSGIYCMFQLLDGFDAARKTDLGFHEIIFVVPLFLSIFHIFIICKASNSLISGQHSKLCLRIMRMMTKDLMDGKDMKKIEMLYKNLKDFPPQAEIYGGYKINYQILTGMVIFMISYARIFQKIFEPAPAKDLTTTLAPYSITTEDITTILTPFNITTEGGVSTTESVIP